MDDLISRQAAIDTIDSFNVFESRYDQIKLELMIEELPSATDINVGTKLGTNLAEVGTDCISRQDALEAFGLSEKTRKYGGDHSGYDTMMMYEIQDTIENLPPIQPEIVRCKDCKYAEYIDDVQTLWCTECGQGRTVAPDDFCSYAERRTDEAD